MPYSSETLAAISVMSPESRAQTELGAARVLFSTETLRPPLTGIGRYTLELGRALSEIAGENMYFHPVEPAHVSGERSAGYIAHARALARKVPGAHLMMDRVREARFARATAGSALSVYHEPNYLLRPFAGRRVVTVHDLSHLRHPEFHAGRSRRFLESRLPASLACADRIVVPTAFVGRELNDLLDVEPDRIRVVPEGVASRLMSIPFSDLSGTLRAFDLEVDGYVLSVGTLEPRKNLAGLVAAYEKLPEAKRARFPLVVVGAKGWSHGDTDRRIERLRRRGEARVLGYVTDEALRALYAGASGFAYVSWYEGFGLPPLEAMAAGTPVVTSTAEALIEVTGDAALHTPADDIDRMSEMLCHLLGEADLRQRLRKLGPERARAFTWQRAAQATLAVYRELV